MKGAALRPGHLCGGERHPVDLPRVQADLEPIVTWTGQRKVEDQDRPGLHIGHPRWRLPELHGAFALDQGRSLLIHKTDPHRMLADLGPPPAYSQDQMGARVNGGKPRHPHVLKQTQHRQLALLVDQGVVGKDREIEDQITPREWR